MASFANLRQPIVADDELAKGILPSKGPFHFVAQSIQTPSKPAEHPSNHDGCLRISTVWIDHRLHVVGFDECLLSWESNAASKVKSDPVRSRPIRSVKSIRAVNVSGRMTVSCWLMGLTERGPITKPWFSTIVSSFSPFWCLGPE